MTNLAAHTLQKIKTFDEQILVVKRTILLGSEQLHGFQAVDMGKFMESINTHKEFLPRSLMEQDPTYKQIIPYLIFRFNNRYFLMQRHTKASETRLQSKYSLGIGGHVRQEDLTTNSIIDWAMREFHEEINYEGNITVTPLGIVNDDTNEVGKVHLGFVFLLEGNSDNISVKSELQNGKLLSIDECQQFYDSMETWTQFVFDYLIKLIFK